MRTVMLAAEWTRLISASLFMSSFISRFVRPVSSSFCTSATSERLTHARQVQHGDTTQQTGDRTADRRSHSAQEIAQRAGDRHAPCRTAISQE